MISSPNYTPAFAELIEKIEIPDSYYDKAVTRYQSIGEWFCRPASKLRDFEPSIRAQGSFSLGTAICPLNPAEGYDIDLVCELRGLSKAMITQRTLKRFVGSELIAYAVAYGVKAPITEGKRAWRIDYADGVSFHLDVLACVPEDPQAISMLIHLHGISPQLAETAIALTCRTHPGYDQMTLAWPTSNPAGYGLWFEQQMQQVMKAARDQLVTEGRYDSVAAVPTYALKTPLQRAIQLLKRQRDNMFRATPALKPISMLVTTLAARAYRGESDLAAAVLGVLNRMPGYIGATRPFVPNPVNPGEDFADKWSADPRLRQCFDLWVGQAHRDFEQIFAIRDAATMVKHADSRFAVPITEARAGELLGVKPVPEMTPRAPAVIIQAGPRPWARCDD